MKNQYVKEEGLDEQDKEENLTYKPIELNKILEASKQNIINFMNELNEKERGGVDLAQQFQQFQYSSFEQILNCEKILVLVDNTIRKMKNNKKLKKNWNKEDLMILLFVIEKYNLKYSKKTESYNQNDWNSISNFVPGKNPQQCMFKWLSLKKNNLNQYPWTQQQQNQLLKLVKQIGHNKWLEVSQKLYLQSQNPRIYRSAKQCRQHWTCYMDPKLKKGPWTLDEDLQLLKYFLKVGKKWSQISKLLNGRTQNAVKNRFNLIIQKQMKLSGKSTLTLNQYAIKLIQNIQVTLPLNLKNAKTRIKNVQQQQCDQSNNPFISKHSKQSQKFIQLNLKQMSLEILQKNKKQKCYQGNQINPQSEGNQDDKKSKIIKFKKMSLQQLLQMQGIVPATFNKQTMEIVCKDVTPLKIQSYNQQQSIPQDDTSQIRSIDQRINQQRNKEQ